MILLVTIMKGIECSVHTMKQNILRNLFPETPRSIMPHSTTCMIQKNHFIFILFSFVSDMGFSVFAWRFGSLYVNINVKT